MKLVIFEDNQFDQFLPLVWVRGVFELKTGAVTLREKIERTAGAKATALLVRDYLSASVKRLGGVAAVNDLSGCKGDEVLFVNARVRASQWSPPAKPGAQWRGDQLG